MVILYSRRLIWEKMVLQSPKPLKTLSTNIFNYAWKQTRSQGSCFKTVPNMNLKAVFFLLTCHFQEVFKYSPMSNALLQVSLGVTRTWITVVQEELQVVHQHQLGKTKTFCAVSTNVGMFVPLSQGHLLLLPWSIGYHGIHFGAAIGLDTREAQDWVLSLLLTSATSSAYHMHSVDLVGCYRVTGGRVRL